MFLHSSTLFEKPGEAHTFPMEVGRGAGKRELGFETKNDRDKASECQ